MLVVWSLIVVFCLGVMLPKNRIYNLLNLVLTFLMVAILLVLSGLELLGFLIVFIYVGAISIVFLFMLMFLEVPFLEAKTAATIAQGQQLVFIYVFLFNLVPWLTSDYVSLMFDGQFKFLLHSQSLLLSSNTNQLGLLFYTEWSFGFLLCGFLLLVAMLSVILISSFFSR